MALLLRPTFMAGEGPLGFQFRVAEANGLGLAALRDLGIQFDVEALCRLGYWSTEFLDGPTGKFAMAAENTLVRNPRAWNRDVARYCPQCLQQAGHWRFGWEVLFFDACPEHGVWLLDRCIVCRRLLTWQRSELLRCACGAYLTDQQSTPSPNAVVRLSHALCQGVTASASGAAIPLLDQIDLPRIQRLIRFLGAYGDPMAGPKPQKVRGCARLETSWRLTSLAAEIINQWPQSFFDLLNRMQSSQSAIGSGRLSGSFGHFYSLLYRGFPEPEFDFLRRAFEAFVADRWQGSFGTRNRRLCTHLPKQLAWIPAKHARQHLRISQRRLDDLVNEGRIAGQERVGRSGRRFLVVRRADVDAEAVRKDVDIDLATAAELLGLKKRRMAALVTMLIPEARRIGNAGYSWVIPRKTIDCLLGIVQIATPKDAANPEEVSFAQVLRCWPWSDRTVADFLLAVLKGNFQPAGRLGSHQGLVALIFPRDLLREWHHSSYRGNLNSFSVPEVADRLMIKQEVAYFLVRKGLLRAETVGRGRLAEARISPQCLSDFEASYVFGRELAAALGTSPKSIAHRLSRVGIEPKCGPSTDGCRQLLYARSHDLDRALGLINFSRGVRGARHAVHASTRQMTGWMTT